MSHFTVLVIGNGDIDAMLAPFNENAEVDPYLEPLSKADDIDRMLDYYKKNGTPEQQKLIHDVCFTATGMPATDEAREALGVLYENWSGTLVINNDGYFRETTYNPESKWDWYVIGGRWAGYFKAKDGCEGEVGESGVFDNKPTPGWYDRIRKGDVDFEFMRDLAAKEAGEHWDRFHEAVKGLERPASWEEVRAKHGADIDAAREEYNSTPYQEAAREVIGFFDDRERFEVPREEFVRIARNSAISTFAFLKDGQWVGRGEMGWFGFAANEKEVDEWATAFNKMLDELPDDTMLTVVDCHI